MRVAIDTGHNPPEDLGAISVEHKLCEYIEAHEIVSHANRLLYAQGIELVNFGETLKRKVKLVNKARPNIAIEVHLNSSNSEKARGALCMYYPQKRSRDLARFILQGIKDATLAPILGSSLPTRGAYIGHYRLDPSKAILYFLRKTKCPAVVVEPLFISNKEDADLLRKSRIHNTIAAGIYLGVIQYAKIYPK